MTKRKSTNTEIIREEIDKQFRPIIKGGEVYIIDFTEEEETKNESK